MSDLGGNSVDPFSHDEAQIWVNEMAIKVTASLPESTETDIWQRGGIFSPDCALPSLQEVAYHSR